MKYYKVVQTHITDTELSYISSYMSLHVAGVRYKIGEWVEPRGQNGPLCVFSDLSMAKAYAKEHRFLVFECEIVKSCFLDAWTIYNDTLGISKMWSAYYLPNYTVLADKVKLIKQVE